MLDVLEDELAHDQGNQDTPATHPDPADHPELLHMELSECAFYGAHASLSVQTMKVEGLLRNQPVRILLDSGSTHNFLDSRLAKKWGWLLDSTLVFEVMIANGEHIQGNGCYQDVLLSLGGYNCSTKMFPLPLGGCDLVLGVHRLSSINPVLWDFHFLTLEFSAGGHTYKLHHSVPHTPLVQEISVHQMDKEVVDSNMGLLLYSMASDKIEASDLTPLQLQQLQSVLVQFEDVFAVHVALPPPRDHDHQIPLILGAKPPNIRPYHYGPLQKSEIEKAVQELLDAGFIRPSRSPFSFPVLLVRKKDSTWRMCMDYRELNAITVKDRYPIPLIDDLLDELFGAQYFTKLDLRSGYHQIRMYPSDVKKTAFRTHAGHYEFLVMPFGLTNAPVTFQNLMNDLFRPFLRKFILVSFDDILIYSKTWEDHLLHLQEAFSILLKNQLYVKKQKCAFGQCTVEYLGHLVSREGVSVDPTKIKVILEWPAPTTVKQLRGFLGLTGYYRKFVPGYGKICQPLYQLTKKDSFFWSPTANEAFEHLKKVMASPQVLTLPDFSKPFELECDASGQGIGVVLQQEGRPVAFTSQALGPKNQALSTYERELIAIVHAIKKWQNYLQGRHFIIRTDHNSLKYFLNHRANTAFQQKWVSKLLGYDYEIQYKHGKDNVVADALSGIPTPTGSSQVPVEVSINLLECRAITYPYFGWLDELRRELELDPWIKDKSQEVGHFMADPLQNVNTKFRHFHLDNGFLKYKGRIILSPTSGWKPKVLEEHHSTPTAGHQRVLKTYQRLKKCFYWQGMKQDIKKFVSECAVCQ